jgi:thiol-disulfide isomerase/thioredoxin
MRFRTGQRRALRRLLWVGVALTSLAGADGPRTARLGEQLGPADMRGLNGPSRSLASFRGKPLVINVWASWCEPCRAEMKSFDRLAWLPIGRQINLIGISTDDRVEDAQAWLASSNATISQFIDSGLQLETMLGASTLPLTVLVSADGTVLGKVHGAREWDSPEALGLIRSTFALSP